MEEKKSKNSRILDMYERLCAGKVLNKAEEARRFGIDERSVQRDIEDIRTFLDERRISDPGDNRQVCYDRKKKGYVLTGNPSPLMTNSEILAVSKILLESRAFSKQEMWDILDKLVSGCVPQRNMKLVSDLLANEKYHYVELSNPANIQDKLWDMGNAIQQKTLLQISYTRQGEASAPVDRIVEPVSILFSEYYFYLNAYIVEKLGEDRYAHKYDYPAIFRIDRIASYCSLNQKFSLPYANRFQEGEFRKRIQFMYAGQLEKVRFQYAGRSVEAVLDRLPTAKILSQNEQCYILEAEVYGEGILMWFLSQGDRIEVLEPAGMREKMKQMLLDMLGKYQG